MVELIGLNGRLRSGKDTVFTILERAFPNCKFVRIGFADKLKLSAAIALGYEPQSVEEAVYICNRIKENGYVISADITSPLVKSISGREFLQRYGTEAHRDIFGTNFWVDALLPYPSYKQIGDAYRCDQDANDSALAEYFPGVDAVFVTDCRFENEAERILNLGGRIWHIAADKRLGPLPQNSHSSEHGLPKAFTTVTLPNNGTLSQFEVTVLNTWKLVRSFDAV